MNSKQFKIKMIELDINQKQLAEKLGVSLKTVNSVCNKPTIPLLYQWALKGLEFEASKEASSNGQG